MTIPKDNYFHFKLLGRIFRKAWHLCLRKACTQCLIFFFLKTFIFINLKIEIFIVILLVIFISVIFFLLMIFTFLLPPQKLFVVVLFLLKYSQKVSYEVILDAHGFNFCSLVSSMKKIWIINPI